MACIPPCHPPIPLPLRHSHHSSRRVSQGDARQRELPPSTSRATLSWPFRDHGVHSTLPSAHPTAIAPLPPLIQTCFPRRCASARVATLDESCDAFLAIPGPWRAFHPAIRPSHCHCATPTTHPDVFPKAMRVSASCHPRRVVRRFPGHSGTMACIPPCHPPIPPPLRHSHHSSRRVSQGDARQRELPPSTSRATLSWPFRDHGVHSTLPSAHPTAIAPLPPLIQTCFPRRCASARVAT